MRHAATVTLIVLRGGALALLFGVCYAAGYAVGLVGRVLLWAGAAFVAGIRGAW